MERVLLEYYNNKGKLKKRITASTANWNGKMWTLNAVVIQKYNGIGLASPTTLPELKLPRVHEKPSDFARESKRAREMSYTELSHRIKIYKRTKFMDTTALQVELAKKTSLPFASFFFAIIGASFGLTNNRGGAFIGFGISILIIFAYYVLMSFFMALGKSGFLPPMLSAWMQNIISAFVGLKIVAKINK